MKSIIITFIKLNIKFNELLSSKFPRRGHGHRDCLRAESTFLTGGVVQHLHISLLQDTDHHVTGGLASAVEDPGGEGLLGTEGAEVDHSAPQALVPWKRLQHASCQAEG